MRLGPLALASLGLAFVLLAGCAKGPTGTEPTKDEQGRYVIHMTANQFDPVEAKVPLGATVVWVNDSAVSHDVQGYLGGEEARHRKFSSSYAPPDGDGLVLGPGTTYAKTLNEAGTWVIWCHTHHEDEMRQVIHVA